MIVRAPMVAPDPMRHERADRHVGADRRVAGDGAQRMDAARGRRDRREEARARRRTPAYGFSARSTAHGAGGIGFRETEDDGRRPGRRELREIAWVPDEREIAGLRLPDGGDAHDLHVAVALETAVQPFRDVP